MVTVLSCNIGIPFFDFLEQITPASRIVCELSCHQLEYIHVSPHIAILLNIHEEHLDHYGSMERYVHVKQQIYLHQKENDLLFCGLDVLPAKRPEHESVLKAVIIEFLHLRSVCWDITIIWISPLIMAYAMNLAWMMNHLQKL